MQSYLITGYTSWGTARWTQYAPDWGDNYSSHLVGFNTENDYYGIEISAKRNGLAGFNIG